MGLPSPSDLRASYEVTVNLYPGRAGGSESFL